MSSPIIGMYAESFLCFEMSETICLINSQVRETDNEKPNNFFIFLNSLFFAYFILHSLTR